MANQPRAQRSSQMRPAPVNVSQSPSASPKSPGTPSGNSPATPKKSAESPVAAPSPKSLLTTARSSTSTFTASPNASSVKKPGGFRKLLMNLKQGLNLAKKSSHRKEIADGIQQQRRYQTLLSSIFKSLASFGQPTLLIRNRNSIPLHRTLGGHDALARTMKNNFISVQKEENQEKSLSAMVSVQNVPKRGCFDRIPNIDLIVEATQEMATEKSNSVVAGRKALENVEHFVTVTYPLMEQICRKLDDQLIMVDISSDELRNAFTKRTKAKGPKTAAAEAEVQQKRKKYDESVEEYKQLEETLMELMKNMTKERTKHVEDMAKWHLERQMHHERMAGILGKMEQRIDGRQKK